MNKHIKRVFVFLAIFIIGAALLGYAVNRPELKTVPMPTAPMLPGEVAAPAPVLASPSSTSSDLVAVIGALGGLIGSIGAIISAWAAIIAARKTAR